MILGGILLATILISLGSLVGVFPLLLTKKSMQSIIVYLVALSAGTLIGDAFIHILPEAIGELSAENMFLMVLLSFIGFFIIEKYFHWRHCHTDNCDEHTFGYMNLIGDAMHNFIDGLIIAAAFTADISLGIATTVAIALHEIPQEIGDFAVLLHAGWSKKKALLANLGVALFSVLGGVVGYFLAQSTENFIIYLLPIAAGGFIYIGASDLIPELRKETNAGRSARSLGLFLCGVGLMYLLTFLE